MTTSTLLQLNLVLHITGFTIMAGTILADFAISRRLGSYLLSDKPKALNILETTAVFARLIGIGAALLITTGIAMVIIFKGAVAQMLWFKIKMVLVLLILLNGILVLRRGTNSLIRLLQPDGAGSPDGPVNNTRITTLKGQLTLFHGLELLLFLIIFVLSVFRF